MLIRKCKEDKKFAFIYARITVDGERAKVSTKEKITTNDWDPKKEIIKGKTMEVKEVNHHLEEIRHKIRSQYRLLAETESLITAETVKEAYLGIHSSKKGHTTVHGIENATKSLTYKPPLFTYYFTQLAPRGSLGLVLNNTFIFYY